MRKGLRLARQMHAGAVTVNDHLVSHGLTETPWGGFKDSGGSRGHGASAFEEVTTTQVIIEDWFTLARRNVFWQPYSTDIYLGLKGMMVALYGSGLGARLRGLLQFSQLLPRMLRAQVPVADSSVHDIATPFASSNLREQLVQLELLGEEAYSRMYDSRSPSGDYSEAKDNFHAAIGLAQKLGLKEEVGRLEKRLMHIKAVFRSQFS
jgi:hypothetical protein